MNKRLLSVLFILIGGLVIFVNYPLKPFDSGFDGPIVILFEFAGPLVFIMGIMLFGYQLAHYKKEREWPEEISGKFFIFTLILGFIVSAVVIISRFL